MKSKAKKKHKNHRYVAPELREVMWEKAIMGALGGSWLFNQRG